MIANRILLGLAGIIVAVVGAGLTMDGPVAEASSAFTAAGSMIVKKQKTTFAIFNVFILLLERAWSFMSNTQLFFSGDQYFQSLLKDINSAQSSIWVEAYIFDLDMVGLEIWEALLAARKRGLQVRLLIDGAGCFHTIPEWRRRAATSGFRLKVFHELPFRFSVWKKRTWKRWRRWRFLLLIDRFGRMNQRNHRKIIWIDERILYTGSYNFSQVHSERLMGGHAWRDTGVRLQLNNSQNEHDIHFLKNVLERAWSQAHRFNYWQRVFRNFWSKSWTTDPLRKKFIKKFMNSSSSLLRLNYSFRQRWRLNRDLIKKIKKAQTQVLITNAYFIPRPSLLRALKAASARGVHVALCLPGPNDVWLVKEASRSLYRRLLKRGIKIYEYQQRMMHAKTLIIDHWHTVGSHNLNHRSFLHDLEIEVQLTQADSYNTLLTQWYKDLEQSSEVTDVELTGDSIWRQARSRVLFWFRYWL